MEFELFRWLGAGGDVATMALAFFIWKVERRVLRLEWKIFPETKTKGD